MYFFTDIDLLQNQIEDEAFGPVSKFESTQYRVTSLHHATKDSNAYAICNGLVFAQDIGNGRCNVILKPTQQQRMLAYPIKYFIYKGLYIKSIIDENSPYYIKTPDNTNDDIKMSLLNIIKKSQDYRNSSYDKLHNNPEGTTQQRATINALGFNLKSNAQGSERLPDNNFIDEIFQKNDIDQFPRVTGGSILGKFPKDKFGFEIILEGVGKGPIMQVARNNQTIISYNPDVETELDKFAERNEQEKILNYIDPCCFFASFYKATDAPFNKAKLKKTDIYSFYSNSKKANQLNNEELYNTILSKYYTVNRIYLDIRNEHNHSLNYYKNYNVPESEYAKIKIACDTNDTQKVDYNTHGWPIYIIDTKTLKNSTAICNTISLKLPIKDNSLPTLFLSQGYFYTTYPSRNNNLVDIFPDQTDEEYSIIRKIAIPKLNNEITVPNYVNIRYIKRITNQPISSPNYVLKAEHYIDNLFELTQLINSNGPIIPFNNNDITQWAYTGIDAFVDKSANYGNSYIAQIGIAKDLNSVSFFALSDNENFIAGSSNNNSFQTTITKDFPYYNNMGLTIKTVNNGSNTFQVGISDLLPDSIFDLPFNPNTLKGDGRSLILISISDTEFEIIQQKSSLLEEEYDKRLALKKHDTEFVFEGKSYLQYEIIIRGYIIDEKKDLTPHDVQTEIYIIKLKEDTNRLFCSQGYLMNLQIETSTNKNKKDSKKSFLSKDFQLNIRKQPYIPQEDNLSNVLITAFSTTQFNVLGKLEDKDKHVWYYVEWEQELIGLQPNDNTKSCKIPSGRGWLRPNANDNDKFDRAFYFVVSSKKFISDLTELNKNLDKKQIDAGYSIDTMQQRITRLRQMTHKKGNLPQLDLIGTLFNDVIGSSAVDPKAEYLNELEYEGGTKEFIDNFNIDTKIQIFRDYMGINIGDTVIDLHHLFVGLDVLNHFNIDKKPFLLLDILSKLTNVPKTYGNNVDSATWAGDLGAISADMDNKDNIFKNYWNARNPNASEIDRKNAFFKHFYETRASDVDMIADAIVHRIHKSQNSYLIRQNNFKHIESLLYFELLMISQTGINESFRDFFDYLGLDISKTIDPNDPNFNQFDKYNQILDAINLFSYWWYIKNNINKINSIPKEQLNEINEITTKTYMKWLNKYRSI